MAVNQAKPGPPVATLLVALRVTCHTPSKVSLSAFFENMSSHWEIRSRLSRSASSRGPEAMHTIFILS